MHCDPGKFSRAAVLLELAWRPVRPVAKQARLNADQQQMPQMLADWPESAMLARGPHQNLSLAALSRHPRLDLRASTASSADLR